VGIGRDQILAALEAGLRPDPSVHALWLEGSLANGRADELSDIDLWLDVDDERVGEALACCEAILGRLGPLDRSYERPHPHPLIRQRFFHLAGTPPTLTVDVCAQAHSRVFWFCHEWVEEHPLVIFDRDGTLRFEPVDAAAFATELRERVGPLREDFSLFRSWMTRALTRGDFLESMGYYQARLLPTLVELLRIRFAPTKRDYYLKHAQRDLPPDVVARLADLYRLTSIEDIAARVPLAAALFEETLAALDAPA
jgi:hypothetical protein